MVLAEGAFEIAPECAQGKDLHSGIIMVKRLFFNRIGTQAGKPPPIFTVKGALTVYSYPAFTMSTFTDQA